MRPPPVNGQDDSFFRGRRPQASSSDFSGLHDLTETLLAMDPSTADRATPDSYRRERSERRPPLIVAGLVVHVARTEP
jgi:hypothetical protein